MNAPPDQAHDRGQARTPDGAQGQAPAPRPAPRPEFEVRISPPDLTQWLAGTHGIPGFITRDSSLPGPHVMILSLMHGNEIAGAIVFDRLLRANIQPLRGRLTLGFVNLQAFARFDPQNPTNSRFVDEDLNRVWDEATLFGPRDSSELARARQILPLVTQADVLLDLHSMLWPSDPVLLCGPSPRGMALARRLPAPGLIVADSGHQGGRRLIDHRHFTDPTGTASAILVEAGQHWQEATIALAEHATLSLLHDQGMVASPPAALSASERRVAEVTHVVTAATSQFAFVNSYRGGTIITRRNTLIAVDGAAEIRTPYDNCLLVMPAMRPSRAHTAVRLARFV